MGVEQSKIMSEIEEFQQCCSVRRDDGARGGDERLSMMRRMTGDQEFAKSSKACGVGIGLDSKELQKGKGALIVCLARNGPAYLGDTVHLGDRLVSVDDLSIIDLLKENDPSTPSAKNSKSVSVKLAEALLGKEGSLVTLGVERDGEDNVLHFDLVRAPIAADTEWFILTDDDPPVDSTPGKAR